MGDADYGVIDVPGNSRFGDVISGLARFQGLIMITINGREPNLKLCACCRMTDSSAPAGLGGGKGGRGDSKPKHHGATVIKA